MDKKKHRIDVFFLGGMRIPDAQTMTYLPTKLGSFGGKLTQPVAKLYTFWDYIFSRENKVQTFFFRVHWLSE